VRATVRAAIERGIGYLTLFAFSSENWRRPADEVSILMELFLRALEVEVGKLNDNAIRLKVAGDTTRFQERASKMQWGLMVSVFCISHVPALLTLEIPGYEGRGLLLIAYLVLVVQSSDKGLAQASQAIRQGEGKATLSVEFVVPETKAIQLYTPLQALGQKATATVDARTYKVVPAK